LLGVLCVFMPTMCPADPPFTVNLPRWRRPELPFFFFFMPTMCPADPPFTVNLPRRRLLGVLCVFMPTMCTADPPFTVNLPRRKPAPLF